VWSANRCGHFTFRSAALNRGEYGYGGPNPSGISPHKTDPTGYSQPVTYTQNAGSVGSSRPPTRTGAIRSM
jgi:hypothetical protein